MKFWFITIRKTRCPVFISHYERVHRNLNRFFKEDNVELHYEPEMGLHIHALISYPRNVTKKFILQEMIKEKHGWYVNVQEANNVAAVHCYINKFNKGNRFAETELINEEQRLEAEHDAFMRRTLDGSNSDVIELETVPVYIKINI